MSGRAGDSWLEPKAARPVSPASASKSTDSRDEPMSHQVEDDLSLSLRERLNLLSELQVLLESGIQIPTALAGLSVECASARTKLVLDRLHAGVSAGAPLSSAAANCGRAFPVHTIHLLRAGEASGQLEEMLGQIVTTTESEAALRARLRSALTYPAVMAAVCFIVVAFLLTFIVPRFERLFHGKEAVLPTPTKMLLALSATFSQHGLAMLGGGALGLVVLVLWLRTTTGRRHFDNFLLRMPIIGTIVNRSSLARSAGTLGLMMQSGVPVLVAIEHAGEVASNASHRQLWRRVHLEVSQGGRISAGLRTEMHVPSTVRQMIAAGEEAGLLDRVLLRVSAHLSTEVERRLKDLASLVEPAMVVVMGGVIGFVVLAILLPVFALSRGAGT